MMHEDDIMLILFRGKLEAVKEAAVSELEAAVERIKGIGIKDDAESIGCALDEVRDNLNNVDALFAALEESKS